MVHHKKTIIFSYVPQSKARVMYEENIFCTSLLLIFSYLSDETKRRLIKIKGQKFFKGI